MNLFLRRRIVILFKLSDDFSPCLFQRWGLGIRGGCFSAGGRFTCLVPSLSFPYGLRPDPKGRRDCTVRHYKYKQGSVLPWDISVRAPRQDFIAPHAHGHQKYIAEKPCQHLLNLWVGDVRSSRNITSEFNQSWVWIKAPAFHFMAVSPRACYALLYHVFLIWEMGS